MYCKTLILRLIPIRKYQNFKRCHKTFFCTEICRKANYASHLSPAISCIRFDRYFSTGDFLLSTMNGTLNLPLQQFVLKKWMKGWRNFLYEPKKIACSRKIGHLLRVVINNPVAFFESRNYAFWQLDICSKYLRALLYKEAEKSLLGTCESDLAIKVGLSSKAVPFIVALCFFRAI